MSSILIVEDDITYGKMLHGWFLRNGYEAVLATSVTKAKEEVDRQVPDLILSDLRLPDGDGILLLSWLRDKKDFTPLIIMTSYAEVQNAVLAMKLGAFDYMEKPVNPSVLKTKVEQALERPAPPENREMKEEVRAGSAYVYGNSPEAKQFYEYIDVVAPTNMSVIILGESGTGKEYAAHLIHQKSKRSQKRFIAVDCGSLSRELAPSELFGHLKGSFTSAISNKKGVFEEASGGTVFLDEIGNLSYEVQIQLLRAIQEKKIRPVGATEDIEVDVRIITATNEDILAAVKAGKFREDLYHRLNEFSLEIPPLRHRKEDIGLFATHFLAEANNELGKSVSGFSPEAIGILEKQLWSGNLRELRNVVRRAVLFAKSDRIEAGNLPVLSDLKAESVRPLKPQNEKEQIEDALRKAGGNKSLAAQLLQIDRKTLYNKLHLYGILKK